MPRPFKSLWDPDEDLAPYLGGEVKTYVIASSPRSGSHYLAYLLHDAGVFGYPLEYLNPAEVKGWLERASVERPEDVLKAIIAHRTSAQGWFGLKAHHYQFKAASAGAIAALGTPSFIRIVRQDRVAQAVSLAIAVQTKSWISGMEATATASYDFQRIRKMAQIIDEETAGWDAHLAAADPLVVVYEEMCEDPDATVRAVAQHLGVTLPRQSGFAARSERQADDINATFKARYLDDLARLAEVDGQDALNA